MIRKKEPIKPIATALPDEVKKKRGRPRESELFKGNLKHKHEALVEDIFLLYFSGKSPTELCEIFNITHPAFYRIKEKYNFDEKKKRIETLSREQVDKDMIKTRAEQIKMANAIISITGGSILTQYKEGRLDVKISDFLSSIKAFQLLTGGADFGGGTYNQTNINVTQNNLSLNTREMLNEIVAEMTPEQRAAIIEMDNKLIEIEQRQQTAKEKLSE
jgi:hypothetical protein